MRKIISILFLLTLLLQAIPVLHLFAENPGDFYTAIDEEKPSEKNKELKGEQQGDKVFLSFYTTTSSELILITRFQNYTSQLPFTPHLEMLAQPPDFC